MPDGAGMPVATPLPQGGAGGGSGARPNGEMRRPPLEIVAPAVNWQPVGAPPLLPVLFITIACGACSGFHCLVGSGTTSKQIAREGDARAAGADRVGALQGSGPRLQESEHVPRKLGRSGSEIDDFVALDEAQRLDPRRLDDDRREPPRCAG